MDLICFAHTYTAHQKDVIVTNIEFSMLYTTSQSLQLNEKLLMMQYTSRYLSKHSLYGTRRVVADLATIKLAKIC